jgi:hypothetical protein
MKLLEFKNWMIEVCEFNERTISSRISNCRKVEQAYGDLEINYDKDRCEKIISELNYSVEDERQNKPPRHKVKINGNIKNGSATLKQAINLYVVFEDEMFAQECENDSYYDLPIDENDDLNEDQFSTTNNDKENNGIIYPDDRDDIERLNGFDSLYQLIGSDDEKFIDFFISNSIFISPEAVKRQAEAINNSIAIGERIPVRYSQKMKKYFLSTDKRPSAITNRKDAVQKSRNFDFYSKERENIKVEFDSTGNKNVVDAIIKYGQINYSKFLNFTISHVWARTFDPYFFTALWNVVIIPSYLNPIMDKPHSQQTINEKIQTVIKAICIELYNPNQLLSIKLVDEVDENYKIIASNFIKNKELRFLGVE